MAANQAKARSATTVFVLSISPNLKVMASLARQAVSSSSSRISESCISFHCQNFDSNPNFINRRTFAGADMARPFSSCFETKETRSLCHFSLGSCNLQKQQSHSKQTYMGRAPCCEKMGLKKGPWSPEEDLILINYINKYGHNNWRALPQQAGLLRCGKSCRLRWTNYLRPDIKRGNFTREEEDTIIQLHDMLGNRWSAIAAKLPGRTDNEIKNVWHTHLKKRMQPQNKKVHHKKRNPKPMQLLLLDPKQEQEPVNFPTDRHVIIRITETREEMPLSTPQCSSSDMSTLITSDTNDHNSTNHLESLDEENLALDEGFWSEVLSADNSDDTSNFPTIGAADPKFQFPFSPLVTEEGVHLSSSSSMCDGMDFWYDVYARAEELPELCC